MLLKKALRLWRLFLFFLPLTPLVSQVIYNFPDLVKDYPVIETNVVTTNERYIPKKAYFLETNEAFYNLRLAQNLPDTLENEILYLTLRDYYARESALFTQSYLKYNYFQKQMYLVQKNRAAQLAADEDTAGIGFDMESIETSMRLFGTQTITMRWGTARYIKKLEPDGVRDDDTYGYNYQYAFGWLFGQDRISERDPFAETGLLSDGYEMNQQLNINLKGKIGNRIEVEVQANTRSGRNAYSVEYKGRDDELVSSIKLGKVNLNVAGANGQGSDFITVGGISKEATGLRMTGKKNNFSFSSAISLAQGVSDSVKVNLQSETAIKDTSFIAERFFQLPDKNIRELQFYQQVNEVETNSAQISIVYVNALFETNTLYFSEIDANRYSVDAEEGILDSKRFRPRDQYSLVFYDYFNDNSGTYETGGTSNVQFFLNSVIETNFLSISKKSLHDHFSLIHIPSSDFPDGEEAFSQYLEMRTYYSIDSDLELSSFSLELQDRNGNAIDSKPWIASESHQFENYGEAEINLDESYFRFLQARVFTNNPDYYEGMYTEQEVDDDEHAIQMFLRFNTPFKSYVDLEQFNIIPGSVVVLKNGEVLDGKLYTVNYYTGRVSFSSEEPLLLGDEVEVFFEYRPFGTSAQRFMFANRMDFQIRGSSYIGSTMVLSMAQSTLGSPRIGSESDSQFVMDLDGKLDLISMFQRRRDPDWSWVLDGEYAFSLYNPNLQKKAVINDMEGRSVSTSFVFPASFPNYFFTANPEFDSYYLGKSYFIDFSEYNLNYSRTPLLFTQDEEKAMRENESGTALTRRQDVNFRPFQVKPGPFQVSGEGHLSPTDFPEQSSLVFDWDFSGSGSNTGYVSFTSPVVFSSDARDFSEFNELQILYKIVPALDEDGDVVSDKPGPLLFTIDVGQLNEDLDLDGVRDEETNRYQKNGFAFNFSNSLQTRSTRLGGGYKGWDSPSEIDEANGRLDKEDLNNDGIWRTQDNKITWPEDGPLVLYTSDSYSNALDGVEIDGVLYEILDQESIYPDDPLQEVQYIKATVPINDNNTNDIISRVQALRLNFVELQGETADRGRVVIDKISLRGVNWERIAVDDVEIENNPVFSVSSVNTREDSVYRQNHLGRAFIDDYEELHGSLLRSEFDRLNETALQMEYSLNGTESTGTNDLVNGITGLAQSISTREDNLSYYQELRFYVYIQDISENADENLLFHFGEGTNDYFSLRVPATSFYDGSRNQWYELSVQLQEPRSSEEASFDKNRGDNVFPLLLRTAAVSTLGSEASEAKYIDPSSYSLQTEGDPSLYKIKYYAFGVSYPEGASSDREGTWFINDLHVDNDIAQLGQAYKLNTSISKRDPVYLKNRLLLSGLGLGFSYYKKGLGFSSVDTKGSENQNERYSFNAKGKIIDVLQLQYNQSDQYSVSEFDTELLPLENQSLNRSKVNNFGLQLDWPQRIERFMPDIRHRVTYNQSEKDRLEEEAANEEVLNLVKTENLSKSYFISENKTYQLTKDLAFEQSYEIRSTISREIFLQKDNVDRDSFKFIDDEAMNFLPFSSLFKEDETLFPSSSLLPSVDQGLSEKNEFIDKAKYNYDQQQKAKLGMNYKRFSTDLSFDYSINHYLNFTNTSEVELEQVQRLYESETYYDEWYQWYFPQLGSVFNSPFIDDLSQFINRTYRTSLNLAWRDKISLFGQAHLSRIQTGFSFSTRENNFQKRAYSFDELSFIAGLEEDDGNFAVLSNAALEARDFFTNELEFKDIQNTFSLNFNAPIFLGDGFMKSVSPFSFSRNLSVSRNEALNEDSKDFLNTLDDELRDEYVSDFSKDYLLGRELEESIPVFLGLPPYFDWWFVNQVFYGFAYLLDSDLRDDPYGVKKAGFINRQRIRVAEKMDESIDYIDGRENSDDVDILNDLSAHDAYLENFKMTDNFNLSFSFNPSPLFDYFFPNSLAYSGNLVTSKNNLTLAQSSSRNLRFRKDFNKFSAYLDRVTLDENNNFNRRFNVNGEFTVNHNFDYNTKVSRKIDTYSLRNSFKLNNNLNFSANYSLNNTEQKQLFRMFYEDASGEEIAGFYEDYMGIGEPAIVSNVEDDFSYTEGQEGLLEVYNVGSLEELYKISQAGDLGVEKMDYRQYQHDLRLRLSWVEREPVVLKFLRWQYELPPNSSQSVGLEVSANHYTIPGINTDLFDEGKLSPQDQPNSVARKNLLFFESPVNRGGEFTRWLASTRYGSTYTFSRNFTMNYNLTLAMVSRVDAQSYVAYKKINYSDNFAEEWRSDYLRERDYIQLGFEIELGARITF